MTEYKTLRVPADELEVAREAKTEDETWGEFLMRCADEPPTDGLSYDDVRAACRDAVEDVIVERGER